MPVQSWESLSNSIGNGVNQYGDGSALASSSSEAIISPGAPDLTFGLHIPPLDLGQVVQVWASGEVSTTATPTMTLRLRYGGLAGTLLASSGAMTTGSGISTLTWVLTATLTCRAVGTSGSIMCIGQVTGIAASVATVMIPVSGPVVATVDTTAQKALVLTGQWSAPSASNTITVHQWAVESLN